MRGIAMSDLHLSFTRHPATTSGRNAREVDVERALEVAVTRTIEYAPDLVTIAGDVFDHPRPSTWALKAFQFAILRILSEVPHAQIVIIPGNHEGTKSIAALTPVVLAEGLDHSRVHVIQEPKRVVFRLSRTGERCAVSCFPFGVLHAGATYDVAPDPTADVNVLLLHAAVRTSAVTVRFPVGYGGAEAFDVGSAADQFDVIACGDYHEFTRLHPERLAFYSGSIERTSSNIWNETAPKGVVAYDTVTEQAVLVEIPTRPMFNYADVSGAEGVNGVMRDILEEPKHRGAMVRLLIEDFPREERDEIDQRLVRELKELSLHFHLDLRMREASRREMQARRESLATSLDEEAATFMADEPEPVRTTALGFLTAAGGVSCA